MAAKLFAYEIAKLLDESSYFFYEKLDNGCTFNSILKETEELLTTVSGRKIIIEMLEELQDAGELDNDYLVHAIETM